MGQSGASEACHARSKAWMSISGQKGIKGILGSEELGAFSLFESWCTTLRR